MSKRLILQITTWSPEENGKYIDKPHTLRRHLHANILLKRMRVENTDQIHRRRLKNGFHA